VQPLTLISKGTKDKALAAQELFICREFSQESVSFGGEMFLPFLRTILAVLIRHNSTGEYFYGVATAVFL
jgi:hypothetical protein